MKKLSNKELVKMVQTQFEKLKNPSKSTLTYSCMVAYEWNHTQSMENIGMFEVVSGVKFSTEQTEPKHGSKFEELKKHLRIIGTFTDKEVAWLITFPESWKQELKEVYEFYTEVK